MTLPNGDVFDYFMDTDYYVPIKIESKRMVRGEQRDSETSLGDYKEVNGWYLPFSSETGVKGSNRTSKISWDKIEANVPVPDSRFERPPTPGAMPAVRPKAQEPKKPPVTEEKKPPVRNEE